MDLQTLFTNHVDLPPPGQPLDRKLLPTHGGVYAFADDRDAIIQTISAQNIRRSAGLRLEPPAEGATRKRADIRAVARRVWWIPTYSVFESMLTYLSIARKVTPGGYRKRIAFGPCWFACINPADRLPQWRIEKYVFTPGAAEVGPFDRRSACAEFIELLEDVFDLCRHHDILERTPDGEPCAYFEMGKCPAPCDGSIPLSAYRDMLAASIRFATGETDERLNQLQTRMRRAADRRGYAEAARIKESLARARKTLARGSRIGLTAEHFRYLIVQRGERRSRVKPFFVDRGRIESGESVDVKRAPEVIPGWPRRLASMGIEPGADRTYRSECVWLVTHFLSKADNAPGLFIHADELHEPDKLGSLISNTFSRPVKRTPDSDSISRKSVDQNL